MLNYAEIYVYEPVVFPEGNTEWQLIAQHSFDRQYFQPTMSDGATKLFKDVIEADLARQKAAQAEHELKSRQLELERQQRDQSGNSTPQRRNMDGTEELPPVGDRSTDSAIEDYQRQILGLSPSNSATTVPRTTRAPGDVAPTNEVNVNVGTQPVEQTSRTPFRIPHLRLPKLFHKQEPPQVETRIGGVYDSTTVQDPAMQPQLISPSTLPVPEDSEDF